MKNTELTYAEIEILQFALKCYMSEFGYTEGEKHSDELWNLKVKLIAMRGALEKQTTIKNK